MPGRRDAVERPPVIFSEYATSGVHLPAKRIRKPAYGNPRPGYKVATGAEASPPAASRYPRSLIDWVSGLAEERVMNILRWLLRAGTLRLAAIEM